MLRQRQYWEQVQDRRGGVVSIELGVLRPVNHYGYIRAIRGGALPERVDTILN